MPESSNDTAEKTDKIQWRKVNIKNQNFVIGIRILPSDSQFVLYVIDFSHERVFKSNILVPDEYEQFLKQNYGISLSFGAARGESLAAVLIKFFNENFENNCEVEVNQVNEDGDKITLSINKNLYFPLDQVRNPTEIFSVFNEFSNCLTEILINLNSNNLNLIKLLEFNNIKYVKFNSPNSNSLNFNLNNFVSKIKPNEAAKVELKQKVQLAPKQKFKKSRKFGRISK